MADPVVMDASEPAAVDAPRATASEPQGHPEGRWLKPSSRKPSRRVSRAAPDGGGKGGWPGHRHAEEPGRAVERQG